MTYTTNNPSNKKSVLWFLAVFILIAVLAGAAYYAVKETNLFSGSNSTINQQDGSVGSVDIGESAGPDATKLNVSGASTGP